MKNLDLTRRGRVIKIYRSAYPDPVIIAKGDKVSVLKRESDWDGWLWCATENGKEGWIPEKYLETCGSQGKACRDYNGTELTVSSNESLEILEEESGWIWCRTERGDCGWIPRDFVEIENC